MALPVDVKELMPPIMRPLGFLLLLAAIRWRSAEGRLLLAIAFVPQTALPYELVPLVLIPASLMEMGIFVVVSWIPVAVAAGWLGLSHSIAGWTPTSWTASLAAVYLPMLYLVLRRPRAGRTQDREGAPAPQSGSGRGARGGCQPQWRWRGRGDGDPSPDPVVEHGDRVRPARWRSGRRTTSWRRSWASRARRASRK